VVPGFPHWLPVPDAIKREIPVRYLKRARESRKVMRGAHVCPDLRLPPQNFFIDIQTAVIYILQKFNGTLVL
jgi:hypothetical protein